MSRRLDLVVGLLVLGVCALFLPRLFVAEESAFRRIVTLPVLLYVGTVVKLVSLMVGAIHALRCSGLFDDDNPARRAWFSIGVWLGVWSLGQATLGFYQIVLLEPTPFPSAADVFFLLGYPLLISALIGFYVVYARLAFPFGLSRRQRVVTAVEAVVLCVVAWLALAPVGAAGGSPTRIVLNLVYPALDLVVMVPAFGLMRMTWRMRGGAIFRVWATLLAGIVCFVMADVLYAYFTVMRYEALDPLMDVGFLVGYLLVARGIVEQHRVSVG